MGWRVQGSNPGTGNRLFSKHQTSSGAHPGFYLMHITGNYPRAVVARGTAAIWCWPLNLSSPEVQNKWSYTSTPPNWPSLRGQWQHYRFCVFCCELCKKPDS